MKKKSANRLSYIRVILILIGLFNLCCNAQVRERNPTAPIDLLKYYSGDFTDTDGDGMTDVAETLYGYDANDANSFPNYDFFLDDGVVAGIPNDSELGSDTDQIYFRFSKFSDSMKTRTREFLILLMPIMYDMLGNPAESFICTFYNVNRNGSWMSANSGRAMYCNGKWIPRLLVHELVHAWKGKYAFTSKGKGWGFRHDNGGFEESAEGLAYEIIHEFIKAYPTHDVSSEMIKMGAWGIWSAKMSVYDLHKHQRFTGTGNFWVGDRAVNTRYNAASVTAQILLNHDKYFMKKVLANYYNKIQREPDWRPNHSDLTDLWAEVVPYVNGVDTKTWLNAIPVLQRAKLEEGTYPMILNSGRAYNGGTQQISVGYAEAKYGNIWFQNIGNPTSYNFPSWLNVEKQSNGYHLANHFNQPFEVKINTIYNEEVLTYTGVTNEKRNSKGDINTLGEVTPHELHLNKFPIGLYKQNLTFTEYAKYTDKATEDYYFFGFKGFKQNKQTEVVLFIGIDSQVAKDVSITFENGIESVKFVNGCAIFRSTELPMNISGPININVTSYDGRVNVYRRTLLNGGSNDDYRQQQFLIIDQDFDGIEDLYDSDVIPMENSSHITYNEVSNETYESTTPKTDITSTTPTVLDVLSTTVGVELVWTNSTNLRFYLMLMNGTNQLYWGGHAKDHAVVNYNDFNLVGTEILTAKFGIYDQDGTFRHFTDELEIDLSDFSIEVPDASAGSHDHHDHSHDHSEEEVATTDVQVETETAVVVVEDVISVEITDDNVTIVNTESNVVVIENAESITEIADEKLMVEETVVLITEESVTVITGETINELNASSSVVVVTDTEVVVDYTVDVSLLEIPELPLVRSIWPTAESTGNDWYHIDWFGYFFKLENINWVYHSQLGWFYVEFTSAPDSVWMYHSEVGWVWTNLKQFPYVYNSYDNVWMFINLVHNSYFNYTNRKWMQFSER